MIKHLEKVQASQMTAHAWLIQSVLLYLVLLLAICRLVLDFADCWILLVQFCAQVVVDHLKRYDKDGKGALNREELQEAIRGAVCRGVMWGV